MSEILRWLLLAVFYLFSLGLVWLLPCYLWERRHGEIPAWLAMSGFGLSLALWLLAAKLAGLLA